jgi:hypothetical protein
MEIASAYRLLLYSYRYTYSYRQRSGSGWLDLMLFVEV